MEDWRRSSRNWERPQKYGRPPAHPSAQAHQSLPSWERRFCASVGISWRNLCETQKVMHMYKNVAEWDDSGALQGFHNAKARFWAELNGRSCNIPLPDPYLHTEKVDYYPVIDPELVADLDKKPPEPSDVDRDPDNGWDSSIFAHKPIEATGWGDAEEDDKPIVATGWGDADMPCSSSWDMKDDFKNAWSSGNNDGNWNGFYHSSGWGGDNSWGNKRNSYRDHWDNEASTRNGRKREGGQFGSRSSKSRHQVDHYHSNDRWGNNRGGTNYPPEKTTTTTYAKQPIAMW